MMTLSRRRLLQRSALALLAAGAELTLSGCRQRIIEVERIVKVEKEVTKVVTEIVRETVIVHETEAAPSYPEATTPTPPQPTIEPRVELVIDVIQGGWSQFEQRIAPTFEETFPQLALRWRTHLPWPQYYQQMEALHASDQLGDLLQLPIGVMVPRWTEAGLLQPLPTEALAASIEGLFEGAVEACQVDSQQMALPFVCHLGDALLLYRPEAFAQAGLSPPDSAWNLDDLTQVSAQMSSARADGDRSRYGYALRYQMPTVKALLTLFGAKLFSYSGMRCGFDTARAQECLDWAERMIHEDQASPAPHEIEGGALTALLGGEVAMARASLGSAMSIQRAQEIQAMLFPPHPHSEARAGVLSGIAYAISSGAKAPTEALDWLRFVTSYEMGVQLFLGGYAEPGCRPAVWHDARVLEAFPACAALSQIMEKVPTESVPHNLRPEPALEIWNREIQGLLRGERSAVETRKLICREIDDYLASSS